MNKVLLSEWVKLINLDKEKKFAYENKGDTKNATAYTFKLKALNHVYSVIKKLGKEIKDVSDLDGIPGIGKGSRQRIEEILSSGKLAELNDKSDKSFVDMRKSLDSLMEITGMGDKTAHKLYKEGITSVKQLKRAIKNGLKISPQIKLGLKYLNKVKFDIPRRETAKIEKYLQKKLTIIDSNLKIIICGSYRRGNPTSGDIDAIIYDDKIKTKSQLEETNYLVDFVNDLTDDGFLLDHMTDKKYDMKYMGFCKFKDYPIRRIDFRMFAMESLHSAILYFTGPFELNTEMRRLAGDRGMKLNEYGLYSKKIRQDLDKEECEKKKSYSHYFECKNGIVTEYTLIKTKTEEDIFKKVGLRYLRPDEREKYYAGTKQAIGKD